MTFCLRRCLDLQGMAYIIDEWSSNNYCQPNDTAACWGRLSGKAFHLQMTSFAKLEMEQMLSVRPTGLTMTMRPLFKASLLTSKDSNWRCVTTLNQILVFIQTHLARDRSKLIWACKRYDKSHMTLKIQVPPDSYYNLHHSHPRYHHHHNSHHDHHSHHDHALHCMVDGS